MSDPNTHMSAAQCSRLVTTACQEREVFVGASTRELKNNPQYYAVTTVRGARGVAPRDVLAALNATDRIQAADARFELSGKVVKVWWK